MIKHSFSKAFILAVSCFSSLVALDQAGAHDRGGIGFSIQINSAPPPPPVVVEQPWAAPSPTAVWVEPHYEWVQNGWVWVRGYYMESPGPGYVWIPGHHEGYRHSHRWVSGYWCRR